MKTIIITMISAILGGLIHAYLGPAAFFCFAGGMIWGAICATW